MVSLMTVVPPRTATATCVQPCADRLCSIGEATVVTGTVDLQGAFLEVDRILRPGREAVAIGAKLMGNAAQLDFPGERVIAYVGAGSFAAIYPLLIFGVRSGKLTCRSTEIPPEPGITEAALLDTVQGTYDMCSARVEALGYPNPACDDIDEGSGCNIGARRATLGYAGLVLMSSAAASALLRRARRRPRR